MNFGKLLIVAALPLALTISGCETPSEGKSSIAYKAAMKAQKAAKRASVAASSAAIAANSAIAGSTQIGKNCTISGNCGIIDNIIIGDEVNITALTLVTKSILKPGTYSSGTPVMDHGLWKKNAVAFKKLKDLIKK